MGIGGGMRNNARAITTAVACGSVGCGRGLRASGPPATAVVRRRRTTTTALRRTCSPSTADCGPGRLVGAGIQDRGLPVPSVRPVFRRKQKASCSSPSSTIPPSPPPPRPSPSPTTTTTAHQCILHRAQYPAASILTTVPRCAVACCAHIAAVRSFTAYHTFVLGRVPVALHFALRAKPSICMPRPASRPPTAWSSVEETPVC